ncbi:MAG: hypothetical protein CMJ83_05015 [Planctomycetes bacterium]|nr:hypothetical protein [Planctomycetota bacterium]
MQREFAEAEVVPGIDCFRMFVRIWQWIRDAIARVGSYGPNLERRYEVSVRLAQLPSLSDAEWITQRSGSTPIPPAFVSWFRKCLEECFEFNLSAAAPDCRLVEDLGMFDATWSDVTWDIDDAFESAFGFQIVHATGDDDPDIETLEDYLCYLWRAVAPVWTEVAERVRGGPEA